jgi:hypothetical protein
MVKNFYDPGSLSSLGKLIATVNLETIFGFTIRQPFLRSVQS